MAFPSRGAARPLRGPFAFSRRSIERLLRRHFPAVLLLGEVRQRTFVPRRLLGVAADAATVLAPLYGRYRAFKFAQLETDHDAFLLECALFHALEPARLDHPAHPVRPAGTDWQCAMCRLFDH